MNPAPFLATQASCMRRGLASAADPAIVAVIASIHARSHDRWLATIAVANEHLGPAAGDAVAALYAFHGRLIDSLEQRHMDVLPAEVAAKARAVLAIQLDDLTRVAMQRLGSDTLLP